MVYAKHWRDGILRLKGHAGGARKHLMGRSRSSGSDGSWKMVERIEGKIRSKNTDTQKCFQQEGNEKKSTGGKSQDPSFKEQSKILNKGYCDQKLTAVK